MRFKEIDIAKGLGIIAVVIGHNRFFRDNATSAYEIIYLFHMPLFFILSGAVITRSLDLDLIKMRFVGLFKPYVVGVLVTLPLQCMKPDHPSNNSPWLGFLWGTGNSIYNTPVWFLTSLFSALLILWAIDRITSTMRQKIIIGLGMLAVSMALMETQIGFDRLPVNDAGRPMGAPWNFDLAPLVASFLIWGQVLRSYLTDLKPSRNQLLVTVTVCAVVLMGDFYAFEPQLELNYRHIQHVLGVAIGMIAGVGLIMGTAVWLAQHGPVQLADYLGVVGRSSLIILIFHSPLQGFFLQTIERFVPMNMAMAMAVSLAVAALLTLLSENAINRHPMLTRLFYVRRAQR